MRRVGQARKRDANEADIVRALEAWGCVVFKLSIPEGPDLLVGYRGYWTPLEVKSTTGKVRPVQEYFEKVGIPVVRYVDEALVVIHNLVRGRNGKSSRQEKGQEKVGQAIRKTGGLERVKSTIREFEDSIKATDAAVARAARPRADSERKARSSL